MPERFARLERIFVRAPIYFVTACTAARQALLATAEAHSALIEFAERGEALGAWMGAYVLMPDHLHAFVALDDERISLSSWMKSLKHALSKTLRSGGVTSPLWQKGFFDHVLRSEESAAQKWEYVRDNPVRAGLVSSWQEWPYAGEIFPLEYRAERF